MPGLSCGTPAHSPARLTSSCPPPAVRLLYCTAGTWHLGHKGHLYRNVHAALRRTRGAAAFDILPRFFLLPRDYEEFRTDVERNPGRMYIQKASRLAAHTAHCAAYVPGWAQGGRQGRGVLMRGLHVLYFNWGR